LDIQGIIRKKRCCEKNVTCGIFHKTLFFLVFDALYCVFVCGGVCVSDEKKGGSHFVTDYYSSVQVHSLIQQHFNKRLPLVVACTSIFLEEYYIVERFTGFISLFFFLHLRIVEKETIDFCSSILICLIQ
jgi:hypothetical protein